ncbi:hypothetical protein P171DRAFT_433422 [Karstenula rhodostoma CBS 690.94]|uniref:BTB domain-containing protein n=1 Tax=Karstenula rhodostoma CBS 690.94 TaxID=1392251 RepID=A0A9P4PDK3_9PLEO|nr:hypothetical protein P171DRAFT_433422 [Karstenula rhodostoma CBS 690.94]
MAKKKLTKKQQRAATALQPTTSPYTSCPVAFNVGSENKTYYVLQEHLQNLDLTNSCRPGEGDIHLPDVDESTGHVLVHYLYTGLYQTLGIKMCLVTEANIEFKRALSTYTAAKRYGLSGLQQLAKQEIERVGAEMNIFDVVDAIKENFSKLVCDNTWFNGYLEGKAKTAFDEDHTVFARDNFFEHINDVALAQAMAKCIIELYNNKVSHMLDTGEGPIPGLPEEGISNAQDTPIEEFQPGECHAIEEAPVAECVPCIEDAPIEDVQPEECYAIDEAPIAECVPCIEDAPIEERVTAEAYVDSNFGTPAEDGWDSFSFGSAVKKKAKKKGKKGKKGAVVEEPVVEEPVVEESVVEELPTPAPELVSPPEDEWGVFSPAVKKKTKKGKKGISEVEESSKSQSAEPESVPVFDNTTVVQEADGTIIGNSHSDSRAKSGQPVEAEGEICPVRTKHLLGDEWKNCKQCRAIVRQVTIRLALGLR